MKLSNSISTILLYFIFAQCHQPQHKEISKMASYRVKSLIDFAWAILVKVFTATKHRKVKIRLTVFFGCICHIVRFLSGGERFIRLNIREKNQSCDISTVDVTGESILLVMHRFSTRPRLPIKNKCIHSQQQAGKKTTAPYLLALFLYIQIYANAHISSDVYPRRISQAYSELY